MVYLVFLATEDTHNNDLNADKVSGLFSQTAFELKRA